MEWNRCMHCLYLIYRPADHFILFSFCSHSLSFCSHPSFFSFFLFSFFEGWRLSARDARNGVGVGEGRRVVYRLC